MGDNVIATS